MDDYSDEVALMQAQLDVQVARINLYTYAVQRQRARLRQQKKRRRRFWFRPWLGIERRRSFGLYDQLMVELRAEDHNSFCNFMRMPPDMFSEILRRVGPRITKKHTWFRAPIEPGMKLAITLRHLASGAKYMDMRYGWRVPHNTISKIVREVCGAIVDEYMNEVMAVPTSPEEWRVIADGFRTKWNFPHTLGALDGKHVAVRCPPKSGSTYFNYKKFFSIVLLALVDADYKIIWADIGGRGAASDAQIWNDSDLKEATESGEINHPPPDPLPNDTQSVDWFYIGDDAFGLRNFMQKPFSQRSLTREERIFNYRLSRARRVSENAFGILANRFQVMLTTMQHDPATVRLITTTCIVLHNLMRTRYPTMQNQLVDREDANHQLIPGAWRQDRHMEDCVTVQGPNTGNKEGKRLRNLIKHWVNSDAGEVSWQDNMI
ncbi:uncharacterized protein LOC117336159 [Pecten maximus]|uniref:uncharacterized protein LOC117336159 n=2 Tax=Pecten maximus TaxID=6579 RepID=UPI001458F5D6|nr:uncharacterized protein LOC117336159 [Pecten maximus]